MQKYWDSMLNMSDTLTANAFKQKLIILNKDASPLFTRKYKQHKL